MGSITRGIANNILGNGAVDGTDALSGTIPANNIANASLDNLTAFPPSVSAGIPQVASDPPSPTEGDVWYNTSTYKLKVRGASVPAGSWASGGALNTGRGQLGGAGASSSDALAFGGTPGNQAITELYNGTSWTEVNDLSLARASIVGIGIVSTAVLGVGGFTSPTVINTQNESWDGTSWTEVNDLNTARGMGGGVGTQTAGLVTGGVAWNVSPVERAETESWNGTSWTEVGDLNTVRRQNMVFGTQTAAISASGFNATGDQSAVESWNGTSWTEITEMNLPRYGGGASGISTNGMVFSGGKDNAPSGNKTLTEFWNGSSWTELNDVSTARGNVASAKATTTSTVFFGGEPTPVVGTATEEWAAAELNQNVTLT